jgi:transglutaminase-like putative cysteine protease
MGDNLDYKEFLLETKFCDIYDPEIKKLTRDLIYPCKDDVSSAIQIFNWVRDEVKYNFDFWNVKASETLQKMSGMCANKANLQIAMLRSIGIPAGYMVLRIKKETLRTIATDELYEKSSDIIVHVYCCIMLNGQWIGADASVDRELYEAAYVYVPDWDYVEWNGENHIHIPDNYIVDVSGPFANVDEYMDMPHRFMNDDIMVRSNNHIEELRTKVRFLIGRI